MTAPSTTPIPHMHAASTRSLGSTTGSIGRPRGATRPASGGAVTTSTTSAERHRRRQRQRPAPTPNKHEETTMKIADSTIVVTGANRGLGKALVDEALRRGAKRV